MMPCGGGWEVDEGAVVLSGAEFKAMMDDRHFWEEFEVIEPIRYRMHDNDYSGWAMSYKIPADARVRVFAGVVRIHGHEKDYRWLIAEWRSGHPITRITIEVPQASEKTVLAYLGRGGDISVVKLRRKP